MSNFVNKVKNALDPDRGTTATHDYNTNDGYNSNTGYNTSNVPEGTYGPHSSRVANAADPRVDSDLDRSGHHAAGQTGMTGHSNVGQTGMAGHSNVGQTGMAGHSNVGQTGMAGHSNVGQPTTGHTMTGQTTTGSVPEGTAGPHKSRLANMLDPRVDSDLDKSGRAGYTGTGPSTTTGHTAAVPTTTTGRTTAGQTNTGVPEGTAGPHSSRAANALDPRVDSDLDGSRQTGVGAGTGTGVTGHQPQYANTGTGVGNTGFGSGTTGVNNNGVGTGPVHSSSLANKLDPRVDSSASASVNTSSDGYTAPTTRASAAANAANTGPSSASANADPTSATANAAPGAAPAVEHHHHHHHHHNGAGTTSSTTGTTSSIPASTGAERQYVGGSNLAPGAGNAPNTAGPHNSDLLNKLDPRVDSDLSGNNTYGRNTTNVSGVGRKDPFDAAQVTPSVMREHIGEPTVLHEDKNHGYAERHGSASNQETHI